MMNGKQSGTKSRRLMIENTILVLIVVCVFGFFGYSVMTGGNDTKTETHYVDTSTLADYMQSLSVEETEDETVSEEFMDEVTKDVAE